MARCYLTKIDLLTRIYKWKTDLHDQEKSKLSDEAKWGYDKALSDMLEFLKEFRG